MHVVRITTKYCIKTIISSHFCFLLLNGIECFYEKMQTVTDSSDLEKKFLCEVSDVINTA